MQMMLAQMAQETEACCAANAPTQTGRADAYTWVCNSRK